MYRPRRVSARRRICMRRELEADVLGGDERAGFNPRYDRWLLGPGMDCFCKLYVCLGFGLKLMVVFGFPI